MHNAPSIAPDRFTAMTRLDQNRATAQLAAKSGRPVTEVTRMTIWGNHSATQYPDVFRARIGGRPAAEVIADETWVEKDFIPAVQQRGAAIIEARGASSAASAASAAINHIHDWMLGTAPDDWVSMAIPSDGSYGVPEGLISSFPVTTAEGRYTVVADLDLEDFSRARIDASVAELGEERDAVLQLGLLG
jgi:malate dehydrogenase